MHEWQTRSKREGASEGAREVKGEADREWRRREREEGM